MASVKPYLTQKELFFQSLADDAPVMMWITDASGYCTYINKQWRDFTGQTLDEALGFGWADALHEDDRATSLQSFIKANESKKNYQVEYRLRSKEGSYHWFIDSARPRFNSSGEYIGYVGSVIDISGHKKAEEELRHSEERLRISIESTGLGTWDFNPTTGVLNWDSRTRQLFGISSALPVDYALFLKGIHPADRNRVDALVQSALLPESNGSYDTEYRTVGIEDKKLRWLSAKGKAFFEADGKVSRFIGTVLDITERKTHEEELRQKDERLREALLVASTGTWKIDLETGIDTRDASLNKLLGLEPVETQIDLKDSFTRIHPDDVERMQAALEKAIAEKGAYHEELRVYLPNEQLRWIKDRGQVITDETGKPVYIIGAAIDITEEKQKEAALKINEERFRNLFNNAQVGMLIVDLKGRVLRANPTVCRIFEYEEEELVQTEIIELTHPDFREDSMTFTKEIMTGERDGFVIEKKYLRKSGEVFWGQVSVSLVKNIDEKPSHLVAILMDIHHKKLAEESLKMQAQVLESMDEGVSVSNEEGIILYTNNAEDRMFGYNPGELIGQHVQVQNRYTPEENERIVSDVITQLKTKGFWNGEWHNKRKDGTGFFTFSHITTVALGDKQVFVCVQRDITEEKKTKEILKQSAEVLEQRVQDRTRELKEANELLERSNEELEQFAYITSHDLQEPLRKIKTFANRIEDELSGTTNAMVMQHLGKVISSANRMSALIRDLLDYSTLKKQTDELLPVNLNEILQEVVTDFEVLIAQKGAVINAPQLPSVCGIPLQLTQLFFNLLGNSLKFSKPGVAPVIQITASEVAPADALELGLKEQLYWCLQFQDNGIGFDQKYSQQIFDIFQRLNSRDAYAGTGIGLALSKRVASNHQGMIVAHSKEGEGATFKVYLLAV